jgi:hypothetical protein
VAYFDFASGYFGQYRAGDGVRLKVAVAPAVVDEVDPRGGQAAPAAGLASECELVHVLALR